MKIWAIGDLHLSFGVANKNMDVFGPAWERHAEQIKDHWLRLISPDDLVLLPGDISWAMRLEEAAPDLEWIDRLPGTKIMLKGNHDYWWDSMKKLSAALPPSIHAIQNNAMRWKTAAIGGARLWDSPEYSFGSLIDYRENLRAKDKDELIQEDLSRQIFDRELGRLERSLNALDPDATIRIAMTHYPPIGADLMPSRASAILEKHRIDICVFGHLHNVKAGISLFGKKNGVQYILASSDYLRFQPVLIHG